MNPKEVNFYEDVAAIRKELEKQTKIQDRAQKIEELRWARSDRFKQLLHELWPE